MEPRNGVPKLKTPPSLAASQYPLDVAAIPTMGAFSGVPPMEPRNGAAP